jgi:hypothetical protein
MKDSFCLLPLTKPYNDPTWPADVVQVTGTKIALRGKGAIKDGKPMFRKDGKLVDGADEVGEYSGNNRPFREHLGNIQGTLSEHSGNISSLIGVQETFREHSGNAE